MGVRPNSADVGSNSSTSAPCCSRMSVVRMESGPSQHVHATGPCRPVKGTRGYPRGRLHGLGRPPENKHPRPIRYPGAKLCPCLQEEVWSNWKLR